MTKQKLLYLIPLLLTAISTSVLAAEPENQLAEPDPAVTSSRENPEPTSQTGDIAPGSPRAAEKTPAAAANPIGEFKPTEQIEADSAVSFPIDI